MNKDILGRKIIDLIEENRVQIRENEEIIDIEVSKIRPNPNQPRKTFDINTLKELAQSIKSHGVIQPIIVKPHSEGYITVAGERRIRASILAGKDTIPAIVRDYNSILLSELAILENLQRENLNPIEEALAYDNILKNLGTTHAELGKKIGKSRSYVTNIIGLLNLPELVIDFVVSRKISLGHAKILSKINDDIFVTRLANKVIDEDLSVRRLEEIIKKTKKTLIKKENIKLNKDYIINTQNFFKDHFDDNISVTITNNQIKIKFKDSQHMNSNIIKLLKIEGD